VSLRIHKDRNYVAEKLEIIPNGFDLEQVKPSPAARASLRTELGVPADTLLIGMAARFHPHKGHSNFIQAAARLHKELPAVHFVLCGLDVTPQNSQLVDWIQAAGLSDSCHLLGVRRDVPRLFAGIDIATTASRTEAFPVVIGEAMACGTPCVVTDVGDSAMIVDQTGIVVPAENPTALADGWRKLVEAGPAERHRLGIAARRRVQQHFALPVIVDRYQAIYAQFAAETRQGLPAHSLSQCA